MTANSFFTAIASYGISVTLIVTLVTQILSNRKSNAIALKGIAVNYVDFWMRDPFVDDLKDAKSAFINGEIIESTMLVQNIWTSIDADSKTYNVIIRNVQIKQNAKDLATMLGLLLENLSSVETLPVAMLPKHKSRKTIRADISNSWVIIAKCHKNLISRIKEEILYTDLVYNKITQKYIPLRNAVPSKK